MFVIEKLFGSKKQPTAADVHARLSENDRERIEVEGKLAVLADERASALAGLDRHGLESADLAVASAKRDLEIIEAARTQLQTLHGQKTAEEARDALKFRHAKAAKAVQVEAPAVLSRYERLAREIAEAVQTFQAIIDEVYAVNVEGGQAGLDPIPSPDERYRKHPDVETAPARVEKRQVNLQEHYGPGALPRFETVEVEIAKSVRRGRYLPSLAEIRLPAARPSDDGRDYIFVGCAS